MEEEDGAFDPFDEEAVAEDVFGDGGDDDDDGEEEEGSFHAFSDDDDDAWVDDDDDDDDDDAWVDDDGEGFPIDDGAGSAAGGCAWGDDDDDEGYDVGAAFESAEPSSNKRRQLDTLRQRFVGGSGSAAGNRLLQELADMMESDPSQFGFRASPVGSDLHVWQAQLFDFDGMLDEDLERWGKATGREAAVTLEVLFPGSYPFDPPFVRVLRPRFVHLTGHITIGGSVCMEMLTKSGWTSILSLETALVAIRAEMAEGDGRVDFHRSDDYSMEEARTAFRRVCDRYGWKH